MQAGPRNSLPAGPRSCQKAPRCQQLPATAFRSLHLPRTCHHSCLHLLAAASRSPQVPAVVCRSPPLPASPRPCLQLHAQKIKKLLQRILYKQTAHSFAITVLLLLAFLLLRPEGKAMLLLSVPHTPRGRRGRHAPRAATPRPRPPPVFPTNASDVLGYAYYGAATGQACGCGCRTWRCCVPAGVVSL
jgi:hypothetical protein